jgi:hypothetical protein
MNEKLSGRYSRLYFYSYLKNSVATSIIVLNRAKPLVLLKTDEPRKM